jgi:hypothetical protein
LDSLSRKKTDKEEATLRSVFELLQRVEIPPQFTEFYVGDIPTEQGISGVFKGNSHLS